MNYLALAVVALAGVALGMYLVRRSKNGLIEKQVRIKAENLGKVIEYLHAHEKIQNNDVEKLTKVSNATAERYLSELEKEGKLTQHGTVGHGVFYTLN